MYCGAGDLLFVEGTAHVANLHLKKDTCQALHKEQISKWETSGQKGWWNYHIIDTSAVIPVIPHTENMSENVVKNWCVENHPRTNLLQFNTTFCVYKSRGILGAYGSHHP